MLRLCLVYIITLLNDNQVVILVELLSAKIMFLGEYILL